MKNVLTIFFALLLGSCNSQEKEKKEAVTAAKKDTIEQPKGQWDVRKEYDDEGNLIGYDSIYAYSYSDKDGVSNTVNLDSIMASFRAHFKDKGFFEDNDYFPYFPKRDSLFMRDFFEEDYFFKDWKEQHPKREEMMKRIDSIRNGYLRQFYPGLMESIKKDKKPIE